MEATDLMIGDYVRISFRNAKVVEISKDMVGVEFLDNNGHDVFKPTNLLPIELTAEIFEKNGLPNHRYSDSDSYDYEEWSSEDKRLRVIRDNQGMFARVEDEKRMYTKAMGVANWVNEWQHILRHGGIEKEIEITKED